MKRKRHALILAAVLLVLAGCDSGDWSSGDRVLVAKCLYETELMKPRRFEVVVFKYPGDSRSSEPPLGGPLDKGSPKNYIKRLLGLPGQLLAIFFGQLFSIEPQPGQEPFFGDIYQLTTSDDQVHDVLLEKQTDREVTWVDLAGEHETTTARAGIKSLVKVPAHHLWKAKYMLEDNKKSRELFESGAFKIMRKPPEVMMALRRIVYDNDFQPDDLGLAFKRWKPPEGSRWTADKDFKSFRRQPGKDGDIDWLRYAHLLRPQQGDMGQRDEQVKPQLITDFEAYNSYRPGGRESFNWTGDLMLECDLNVERAEGSFYMELSKGINRFRARFDLDKGMCTLLRQGPAEKEAGKWEELDSKSTPVKSPGTYHLILANFDSRLTLWVGNELPFGDGREYHPPEIRAKGENKDAAAKRRGPTTNDLEPASIGSAGAAVEVRAIKLWRDTYYTLSARDPNDAQPMLADNQWGDPSAWEPLRSVRFKTLYVQPGHYLCLGDNSPSSSDGRDWGLVPNRLMLGRALVVYYPFERIRAIR